MKPLKLLMISNFDELSQTSKRRKCSQMLLLSQFWLILENLNFSILFLENWDLTRVYFLYFRLIYIYFLCDQNHSAKFHGLKLSTKDLVANFFWGISSGRVQAPVVLSVFFFDLLFPRRLEFGALHRRPQAPVVPQTSKSKHTSSYVSNCSLGTIFYGQRKKVCKRSNL